MVKPEKITVSNGVDFIKISATALDKARQEGFYRPAERGKTIVGSGVELIEVPLADVAAAVARGFTDLLASERQSVVRNAVKRVPVVPAAATPASCNDATQVPAAPSRSSMKRVPLVSAAVGVAAVGAVTEGKISAAAPRPASAEPVSVGQTNGSGQSNPLAVELLSGLSEAEQQAADQERMDRERLDQTAGWRWYLMAARMWVVGRRASLVNAFQSHTVSLLVHVAVLLILASLMLKSNEAPKALVLNATPSTDEVIREVVLETEPLEITEPTENDQSEAPPEAEEIAVEATEAVVTPDFLAAIKGTAVEKPALPTSDPGMGKELPKGKPTFFNSRSEAIDYCFVIDNSNSMTRGRFETALHELLLAVNRLTPKQRFYVIFYSDTAYPLFHPYKIPDLVPANKLNKMRLFNWLKTIQLCLKTNGKEAIQLALDLDPDVIFVLGDGAFTDKASSHFAKRADKKIPIHTLGMEVSANNAKQFELLATSAGGTYRDVGVNPLGAQMARQFPRKKNNSRAQIWGITLPVK